MNDRIEKLNVFLQRSPDDPFLNHALALEYIKAGDDGSARRLFEKNRDTAPAYVATYYHLGKLLERNGEPAAALPVYEAGMDVARQAGDQHALNELRGAYEDLAD